MLQCLRFGLSTFKQKMNVLCRLSRYLILSLMRFVFNIVVRKEVRNPTRFYKGDGWVGLLVDVDATFDFYK